MPLSIKFCVDRAEECAEEARNAGLENVRARALRSEAAWRVMAEKAIQIEKGRVRKTDEVAPVAEPAAGQAQ